MDEKKLLKAAKKIAKLEMRLERGDEDANVLMQEMEAITTRFTPQELIAIDELIMSKHLIY